MTRRVEKGAISLAHLPDAGNYVDWMTKWVKESKLRSSLAFLTGERSKELHTQHNVTLAAFTALVDRVDEWLLASE